MPDAQLISAHQLSSRLDDASVRIIDCRFALDDVHMGQRSYTLAHIPGAQYAHLERDLSGVIVPGVTGRHPLPRPTDLIATFQALGLDNEADIVLYDDGPSAFAARAWWLLAWLGKREGVYLLDGGYRAWCEVGLPVEHRTAVVSAGNFQGRPDDTLIVDAQALLRDIQSSRVTLLDARALPRFLGEAEPIDPIAGHIPGAICAPFTETSTQPVVFWRPSSCVHAFEESLLIAPRNRWWPTADQG